MKLIPLTQDAVGDAIDVLKNGGVIAHPTDTCYGLAADIYDEEAVKRVMHIKQMDESKPMTVAVATKKDLETFGELSPLAKKIVKNYFPGAVTLLVPRSKEVPKHYYPQAPLIGLRIPDHELTLKLIRGVDSPITTTSANITGHKECYSGNNVFEYFYESEYEPDLVLNLDIEDQKKNRPSTIVKVVGNEMDIIRQGDVKIKI